MKYVSRIISVVVRVHALDKDDATARAAWSLSRGMEVSGEIQVEKVIPVPWTLEPGEFPPPGAPRLFDVSFGFSIGEDSE